MLFDFREELPSDVGFKAGGRVEGDGDPMVTDCSNRARSGMTVSKASPSFAPYSMSTCFYTVSLRCLFGYHQLSSRDGIHWDEGIVLMSRLQTSGGGDCYSANEIIGKYNPETPERLLIHADVSYSGAKTNMHQWRVTTAP